MTSHLENLWAETAHQTAIEFVRRVIVQDDRLSVLAAALQRLDETTGARDIRLGQIIGALGSSNEDPRAPLVHARPVQQHRSRQVSGRPNRASTQAGRRIALRLLDEAPGGGATTGEVRATLTAAGHLRSPAAVYSLLDSMRHRSWVEADRDQPRKFWRITPAGRRALFSG